MWVPERTRRRGSGAGARRRPPHTERTRWRPRSRRWNPSPPREKRTAEDVPRVARRRRPPPTRAPRAPRNRNRRQTRWTRPRAPRTLMRADTRGRFVSTTRRSSAPAAAAQGAARCRLRVSSGLQRPRRRVSRRSSRPGPRPRMFADVWVRDAARLASAQSGHRHAPRGTLGSLGRRQYT